MMDSTKWNRQDSTKKESIIRGSVMKMKRFVVQLSIFALLLSACSSNSANTTTSETGAAAPNEEPLKVALVLPEKIGVNPFFQQMDEGLKKAGEDFGLEVKTVEPTDINAIEENLRAFVADDYDLIITSSFKAKDPLTKVASENPDKPFVIIDTTVDLPNVRSNVFREHEAAFLVGALAGLSTKTDKVGMVLAMDTVELSKWSVGFREGLQYTNPDAEFFLNYVGSFTDPAKAKELAIAQFEKGADFINGASAVGDLGIFEAAAEKGFYTSGQDIDHTPKDPEHIVTSQIKRTDKVVYDTVKQFVEGTFKTGVFDYGLEEGGVGVVFVTQDSESPLSPFIGQENVDKVKQIRDDIVSGKIKVTNPLEKN